jgi:hypothetical protein
MTYPDPEIEHIRETVDCASYLERLPRPWQLDRAESTKNCLKYRRGKGEILIVNHDGRGWWDPTSDAKGDIFSLVQHLQPGLNFGEVRKLLLDFSNLPVPSPRAARGAGLLGPRTIAAMEEILETLAATHEKLGVDVLLTSATDANAAGDRYAARHRHLATQAGIPFERGRPAIEGGDWNDVLKATVKH